MIRLKFNDKTHRSSFRLHPEMCIRDSSRAEQDRKKTMCQLVDAAKQFYGSGFSDETYENAKKVLTDPNSQGMLHWYLTRFSRIILVPRKKAS